VGAECARGWGPDLLPGAAAEWTRATGDRSQVAARAGNAPLALWGLLSDNARRSDLTLPSCSTRAVLLVSAGQTTELVLSSSSMRRPFPQATSQGEGGVPALTVFLHPVGACACRGMMRRHSARTCAIAPSERGSGNYDTSAIART